MKTVKFHTLGCKVNQYDTQSIREQFASLGFKELDDAEPADVCVINTCTVTHKADSQSLAIIRRMKAENPKARIIVTGCLTELDAERIKDVNKSIQIIKNKDKNTVLSHANLSPITYHLSPKSYRLSPKTGISHFEGHTRAFLKVQDGCNNFCSYCKVPLVRGRSKSRRFKDIIEEARLLVSNGFKEIVLTGICLGSFGKDLKEKTSLSLLISELEKVDGLLRIRLSSIEAGDISDGLIDKMAASRKLCHHLHIPIQSGDDDILRKMRRNYTRRFYSDLIMKIRSKIPGVAITTDCLVGFPGETDENFKNSVDLVKNILPLKVHIFPYSRRDGTQAAQLKEILPPAVIKERIKNLKEIADRCALEYKKSFINKVTGVLFESESKIYPGFFEGRSGNYLKVLLKSGPELKNKLIPVRLRELKTEFFLAEAV